VENLIEIFPFVFGVLLGLTASRLGDGRMPRLAWAAAAVVLGAFATFASGEWRVSPVYFAFDIGLVAVMSLATSFAAGYWRRLRAKR
jgi:hypothetical protein